jgi:hypothetical protein
MAALHPHLGMLLASTRLPRRGLILSMLPFLAFLLTACASTPDEHDTAPRPSDSDSEGADSVEDSPTDSVTDSFSDSPVDTGEAPPVDTLVRINEIMFEPRRSESRETFDGANWGTYLEIDEDTALEYVELFNTGAETVDLSSWSFSDGVDYLFPIKTRLEPGAYVVVAADPETFATYFATEALGPFSGSLKNSGEKLELSDARGRVVDAVTYDSLPPWPVRPGTLGASLERVAPFDARTTAQNWRSSTAVLSDPLVGTGTPGAANAVDGPVPPFVSDVAHSPVAPEPGDTVTVTASVEADGEITAVKLEVDPEGVASSLQDMFDDGAHGDEHVDDGIYGAFVSAGAEGSLTYYRIHVEAGGLARVYPYDDEPSPSRAFAATAASGDYPRWHLFMTDTNIATLRDAASATPRDDPEVDGTLVVDGVAYPHILVSLGGRWNRANPPFQWHFDFNPDAALHGATSIHTNPYYPETQQAVFDAFDTVLDPALTSQLVDILLTVDGTDHMTTTYVAYEAPNGHWLDGRGYDDDSEVYKARSVESSSPRRNSDLFWFGDLGDERADNGLQTNDNFWGAYKKGERALDPPTQIYDLVAALNDLSDDELLPWLDQYVDVEQWFTSIALHVYLRIDDFAGHNFYLLLPGGSGGKWQILNYDFDGFGRYPPLSLFYATGLASDESQDWQRNMLHRRIYENPTLTRIYCLYARRLLDDFPPETLVPTAYVSTAEAAFDSIQTELDAQDLPPTSYAPVVTPCGGTPTTVSISAHSGWQVYATVDGSDPRLSATRAEVHSSLTIDEPGVLRLAAAEDGYSLDDGRWTDDVSCSFAD